jgi:hypothetical protein
LVNLTRKHPNDQEDAISVPEVSPLPRNQPRLFRYKPILLDLRQDWLKFLIYINTLLEGTAELPSSQESWLLAKVVTSTTRNKQRIDSYEKEGAMRQEL